MEKKIISLLLLGVLLFGISIVSAETGCPGREFAEIEIQYSFSPELTGIELEVGPSCAPNSPLGFGIRNYKNDDILVYVDGKGVEHEIWPYQSAEEINYADSLPYCKQAPGYAQCSHELKCTDANAPIIEDYMCFDNQVCCDFENVDNANEWYGKSFYKEEDIPQEVGDEWTRELYFKDSPNEKITLSAKNVATGTKIIPNGQSYVLYYIIGAIILVIVIAFIIFRKKK